MNDRQWLDHWGQTDMKVGFTRICMSGYVWNDVRVWTDWYLEALSHFTTKMQNSKKLNRLQQARHCSSTLVREVQQTQTVSQGFEGVWQNLETCWFVPLQPLRMVWEEFLSSALDPVCCCCHRTPSEVHQSLVLQQVLGGFGIPAVALVNYFMECSTAGQTKELRNNTNHKYDANLKDSYDARCVFVCVFALREQQQCNVQDKQPPFSMNTHSSSPHSHHNQYDSVKEWTLSWKV